MGVRDRLIDPRDLKIEPNLSSYFGSKPSEELAGLAGCTILEIGEPVGADVEGGGLALRFTRPGSDASETIVFGFTEIGMWVEEKIRAE